MAPSTTLMSKETREAATAVARLLERQGAAIDEIAARLRELDPPVVVTAARGSSDHAANFLKYLVEIGLGTPVASVGPSVASIYGARLRLAGALGVSISQSGRSPDLVALQEAIKRGGALTLSLINDPGSPLAAGAQLVVPLEAGEERSVAATKSFIASVAASAAIVAAWSGNGALAAGVRALPDALAEAVEADWSMLGETLVGTSSFFVVGRGPALSIAREAALKGKETANLHAEALSIAEMMHGPLQAVGPETPVLAFVPDDAAAASSADLIGRLAGASTRIFSVGAPTPARPLPFAATGHPATDAIAMAASFYGMIESVSRARGLDPDRPQRLKKVTETL